MKKTPAIAKKLAVTTVRPGALLADVREMILSARQTVARGVNAALVVLHWQIGQRIRKDILAGKRAEYGEEIVATVSRQLSAEFGRGFAERNLANMIRFAEVFPDPKILHALRAKLGWTHFRQIIYWTKLLPKAQLERKLHQAVRLARAALARRSLDTTPDNTIDK